MPRIARDYVLVKVLVAPMCNEHLAYSDWDFRDRNRPESLGHEAAGEVVETGPNSSLVPGDRVVVLSGYPCGQCRICGAGAYAHCPRPENPLEVCGSESGECGFAQYMIKPEWLLVRIPEGMPYEHASMLCCGLGATHTALERMGVDAGDSLLVTGLGQVGLGAIVNGVARGARVVAAGGTAYRRELAAALGAEVVDTDGDAVAEILRLVGEGVDAAVECSAMPSRQRLVLDAVRRGGEVTFLGESAELTVHVDDDLIQKGVTVRGSLDLYLPHAAGLLELISRNGLVIDRFITHTFPLSAIGEAWELQLTRRCGKIILMPWE
ncbi:MAG: alcohol dehydrogenase catalytic domain-containing protein [Actinobacteria bacterium]|jgi:threonine dehydrogenase-like Zn-dependent dehydrogenase|nr:alcohol dehydrogenase catalytic domain-containing protein [Actinomycetota bacterium]